MADDSARFSLPAFSPLFASPFQDNSTSFAVNSNKHGKKARGIRRVVLKNKLQARRIRSVGLKNKPESETSPTLPTLSGSSFNLAAGMKSSPEVFTFSSKPIAVQENVAGKENPSEKPNQRETVVEQSKTEPECLQLILIWRVVKGMPQSPHFWPLRSCSNLAKRLMMEAWDRVFEETVDKIHSIRAGGFWVEAKELWKTLEDLQGMGYNVIALRRRLLELGDVLLEKRRFQSQIMGLTNRAEFHRLEKSRLEYEILILKARVEAEKMRFDDAMATAEKMEAELHKFYDAFSSLAIKPISTTAD